MSARERLMAKLGRQLAGQPGRTDIAGAHARIAARAKNLIPARGQKEGRALVDLFATWAGALGASVERLDSAAAVPAAVADYLGRFNLPNRIKIAPHPEVQDLPWSERPLLEISTGRGFTEDLVSVTPAFAAVAETGTLMLRSGPQTPTTLNFLPDHHIVVLRAGQIVGDLETAWSRLRAETGGTADWPRTVNLITGPSRTADIEQELILGAHGPRRLHILLIDAI